MFKKKVVYEYSNWNITNMLLLQVIYTLLKNLANSGYMQQKAPEEDARVNVVEPVEVCPESDKDGIPCKLFLVIS